MENKNLKTQKTFLQLYFTLIYLLFVPGLSQQQHMELLACLL